MKDMAIINHNDILMTDSRDVADVTDKQHAHLLRDIKGYKEIMEMNPDLDASKFFIDSTYIDSNNREKPCYLLTKEGCDMVANKMSGPKGVVI